MARPIGSGSKRLSRTPEEAFGKTLTELRTRKGMTQDQLAANLGYALSYVGLLERGRKSPTLRTIYNIADLLKVSVASLLARTERNRKR